MREAVLWGQQVLSGEQTRLEFGHRPQSGVVEGEPGSLQQQTVSPLVLGLPPPELAAAGWGQRGSSEREVRSIPIVQVQQRWV